MQFSNHWRRYLAALVLAVVIAVPVAAYQFGLSHNWNNRVDGATGYTVLYAYAGIVSRQYPVGPTFIQVRIDGYGGSCVQGFSWYGWCADNAHGDYWNGFSSDAEVRGPVVPYGCYTSTHAAYIDGALVSNYPIGICFDPPPPPACDPGLDGSYQPGACVSPILIDTGKKTDYKLDPQVRVQFDLNANGSTETAGWTKRNSTTAFLAYDRNGNGVIDDGRELFGAYTRPGSTNGFDALVKEANAGQAGAITASNPLFGKLLLWRDANQDGYSQPEELTPASAELEAIGLGYRQTEDIDKAGNAFYLAGWARKVGGEEFPIYDVFLRVQ